MDIARKKLGIREKTKYYRNITNILQYSRILKTKYQNVKIEYRQRQKINKRRCKK